MDTLTIATVLNDKQAYESYWLEPRGTRTRRKWLLAGRQRPSEARRTPARSAGARELVS